MTKLYSIDTPDGMTRKCLDAWGKCFIKANGDVWLCCNGAHVGNLHHDTLLNILNNEKSREYRQGLIEGKPLTNCKKCVDKPICTTDELMDEVKKYYETGHFLY